MSSKSDEKLTLSLRWGSHSETVLQSLEDSFGDQDFVDLTLACEGQSVQAHKVVVSACSSHLKQLLKENPCPHPIVILKDISMAELKCLLEFMYCGHVTVEQNQLDKLLQAAQALGVRGLATQETVEEEVSKEDVKDGKNKSERKKQAGQATKRRRSLSPQSSKKPRPVPPLQSILAQTLLQSSPPGPSQLRSHLASHSPVELPNQSSASHSPPNTLAKLLSQTPGASQSPADRDLTEIKSEEDTENSTSDMIDIEMTVKQEALEEEIEMDNPASALELEYRSVEETEEYSEQDLYLHHDQQSHQLPASDTIPHDSSGSSMGKATAFMLSLAKRANQTDHHFSQSVAGRKLSFHEPRPCPICRKMYRDAATLRTHVSTMHPSVHSTNTSTLSPNGEGGSENRLAFYEARPCSICGKMYRDAASLRTHTSIMHTKWRDGFECSCRQLFQTKHEMYQHRRSHNKGKDWVTK